MAVSFDQSMPQVMKLFKAILTNLEKATSLVQKRSMHFNLLFGQIVSRTGMKFIEQFDDLEGALARANQEKEDANNDNDVFLRCITFWLR